MKVAVRTDATSEMGIGHLRRCLSLADALHDLGGTPCFVIRDDDVARHVMAGRPYPVFWLPETGGAPSTDRVPHAAWSKGGWRRDAQETAAALTTLAPDWVIVDHYAFDARWHEMVRASLVCAILAIDDLGDRSLAVDVLLDGNAAASHADKYAGRLTRPMRLLTGPRYALLAPAYRTAARYAFSAEVRSIGIFLGGTDGKGLSATVLETLRHEAGFVGPVEIVSSGANPGLEELARACEADGNTTLLVDLPDLAAFYARHDLQIGAGGTSSYERCCIGVPTVAIIFAANQLAVVPVLRALGVLQGATLPEVEATRLLDAPPLATVVQALIGDPGQRRTLSDTSRRHVDGRGAERIALMMSAGSITLRSAAIEDAAMLHGWRNDPATRSVSINSGEIAYEAHVRWLVGVLASPGRRLFVALIGGRPVGAIRFDLLGDGAWEVSLYLDPDLHGLGLGKRMLLAGEACLLDADRSVMEIRAQVVSGNDASLRMFNGVGYREGAGYLVKVLAKDAVR